MTVDAAPAWRRLALRPLGHLVLAVVLLNAAAWAVDSSPLRQQPGSWGYAFGAFFLSLYAVPVLLVVLVGSGLAQVFDDPREQAVCAWVAAGATGVAGVGLALLALPLLLDSPAGTVFGVVALGVAATLVWPLVTLARRR
jgi:hypothetical protein